MKCFNCPQDTHAFDHDPWWRQLLCRSCIEKIILEWQERKSIIENEKNALAENLLLTDMEHTVEVFSIHMAEEDHGQDTWNRLDALVQSQYVWLARYLLDFLKTSPFRLTRK